MVFEWFLSLTHLISGTNTNEETKTEQNKIKQRKVESFEMPLHYPRYTKSDYEKMEEWKIDVLLQQYGLYEYGNGGVSLEEKRSFAIGAFLWPDQL